MEEFEESLRCERMNNEEKIAEIMADCEMERTRVERAERRIEKLGREHRDEIDNLTIKFNIVFIFCSLYNLRLYNGI